MYFVSLHLMRSTYFDIFMRLILCSRKKSCKACETIFWYILFEPILRQQKLVLLCRALVTWQFLEIWKGWHSKPLKSMMTFVKQVFTGNVDSLFEMFNSSSIACFTLFRLHGLGCWNEVKCPRLLLLDEPTHGLSGENRLLLLRALRTGPSTLLLPILPRMSIP